MITEDQSRVIAFLASPSTHAGAAVERIDTHASIVFLAGQRAWKLKRAVRYDYLDFSTADRRQVMCEAEVRINRRTAPGLYRGVVPVTAESNGSLALGGSGTPVDWLVEMVRFDQGGLFDRLAENGALDLRLMRPLAAAIARFHARAIHRPEHGGRHGMKLVVDGNAAGFAAEGAGTLDPALCAGLTHCSRYALDLATDLMESRRDDGLVRQCHGDLHLRNIVLLDGQPTLFDAIEFNDEIACTDVLYDLAFLLMDLRRRKLPRHANALWNAYLAETMDFEGLPLMPLFLSCRAAVRAKTSATAATLQLDRGRRSQLEELARDYLVMAVDLLHSRPASLIAVGGLSGSGKSTLAMSLAPAVGNVPGAIVIRSDEIRKTLAGASALDRLGPEGYTNEVSQRVYAAMLQRADAVVRSGHGAIVDAVFARPADRDAVEHVAHAAGVPFLGLWLDAPAPVLIARAEARERDPSDADARVIGDQLRQETGDIRWHRLDASGLREHVLQAASAIVSERLQSPAGPPLLPANG